MHGSNLRLLVLLFGLVVGPFLGNWFFPPNRQLTPMQSSLANSVERKFRLGQAARHPAVFIAGGSATLTGLRAQVVGELLKRPVYNIAVHSEVFDYRNMVALIEAVARPGDTVVYGGRGLLVDAPIDKRHVPISMQGGLELKLPPRPPDSSFGPLDHSLLLHLLPGQSKTNWWGAWDNERSYGPQGDFTVCLRISGAPHPQATLPDTPQRQAFLHDLADLASRLRARHIQFFVFTPVLLVKPADMSVWVDLKTQTESNLVGQGVQWLHASADNVFRTDLNLFCDSQLHPTPEVANMHSRLLAAELAPHL